MTVPIFIRESTIADAPEITAVHLATWQEGYRHIFSAKALAELDFNDRLNRWKSVLKMGDSTTLVAESAGAVIGFVNYGCERDKQGPIEHPPEGEIYSIYASPQWWGKGIGYRLMIEALDDIRNAGMSSVCLWVLEENIQAISFYERNGFVFTNATKEIEMFGRGVVVRQYRMTIELKSE
ncbi:MAG: GNAT family N-acetyltransferase [Planctomycetaceae bacterium]|nr:GNAT family N-acetyltransferase [Planctomycetaceae bacterium]